MGYYNELRHNPLKNNQVHCECSNTIILISYSRGNEMKMKVNLSVLSFFNNFNTTEFNTISKQIPTSGYDKFISIPYSMVQSNTGNQSTSLLYSTVQPTCLH